MGGVVQDKTCAPTTGDSSRRRVLPSPSARPGQGAARRADETARSAASRSPSAPTIAARSPRPRPACPPPPLRAHHGPDDTVATVTRTTSCPVKLSRRVPVSADATHTFKGSTVATEPRSPPSGSHYAVIDADTRDFSSARLHREYPGAPAKRLLLVRTLSAAAGCSHHARHLAAPEVDADHGLRYLLAVRLCGALLSPRGED